MPRRVFDPKDLLEHHSSAGWSSCPKEKNMNGLEISMPAATVSSCRQHPAGEGSSYEFKSKTS